ncbi:MAG: sigma-54-dependent Fis family transcriptional regulator [Calditrichaeota bacterium]|nr:MAG: sigma-54-dependent Fis family transcriptional regulator [Calditrichota bacterium]
MVFKSNSSPYDLANLNVLVVDDQEDVRRGLNRLISTLGCKVSMSHSAEDALKILSRKPVDIVFTDLKMDGMSGEELLKEINQRWANIVVVLITGHGTIELAVKCLRNGASHFITKPFDNKEILKFVERAGYGILAEKLSLQRTKKKSIPIIAVDRKMKEVLELVERVAPQKIPVLIEGASGTGKELIAHEIHNRSRVKDKPFLAINCIALPDTLLDSELFGYRKGAFTGAIKDTIGLFEQANGGTVFLDEASSMSPLFQGKLLRVLQEKKVRPLGQNTERKVDFRIIAASNKNLSELVKKGEFREDLYYRLQVVKVSIPTLTQRRACIPALAEYFLKKAVSEFFYDDYPSPNISPSAMEELQNHTWSGNVRELENTIQRALIIQKGDKILPSHLGLTDNNLIAESLLGEEFTSYEESKQRVIENFQRQYVQNILEQTNGNISKAAEMCGLTRAALQRILKKLSL